MKRIIPLIIISLCMFLGACTGSNGQPSFATVLAGDAVDIGSDIGLAYAQAKLEKARPKMTATEFDGWQKVLNDAQGSLDKLRDAQAAGQVVDEESVRIEVRKIYRSVLKATVVALAK